MPAGPADKPDERGEPFPWAGPALFCVVVALVTAFFWWFLF